MKQLYIIDPFEKLHIEVDTSVLLMNEALRQGIEVYSCTEFDIDRNNRAVSCRAREHRETITPGIVDEEPVCRGFNLEEFDLVMIRKDPPFDASYLTLLLLLSDLSQPLIVNDPASLLRYNEKLSIFVFPEFITDTIVSSSLPRINRFIDEVGGTAVLKPLFGCSGRDVVLLRASDRALEETVSAATGQGRQKVMVQRYLPEVVEGETRVFMLEDRPVAVMKKIPAVGSFKANFDFGARGVPHSLTPDEERVCRAVGDFCRRKGIVLSALDIIAARLSEFNITSPGLLAESNQVDNSRYEEEVIRFVASRSAKRSRRSA